MRTTTTLALLCFGIGFACLGAACPHPPPAVPDAGPAPAPSPTPAPTPAPPPPTPAPASDAAAPSPTCAAACQNLARLGCSEGAAANCPAALEQLQDERLVHDSRGLPISCSALSTARATADVIAAGSSCTAAAKR